MDIVIDRQTSFQLDGRTDKWTKRQTVEPEPAQFWAVLKVNVFL